MKSPINPIRVLHVIPSMGMGGAERMIVNLLKSLDSDERFDFHICCVEKVDWFYDFKPRREPSCLSHSGPWRNIPRLRRTVGQLRGLVDKIQPDVIHSHLWFADFVTGLANRKRKVPHIVHFHDTCEWKSSARLGFRLRRWLYCLLLVQPYVHFLSCSELVARFHEIALRIPTGRISIVPYGVDCSVFVPYGKNGDQTKIRIGTVGRFVEMKGHRYLFEAVARLPAPVRGAIELALAGDGPLRKEYEDQIGRLGIASITRLLGPLQNVSEFLQSLDVYVQSSSSEALPLAVLEAMACGLPVVATCVAGIPEQVVDGVNGFLVPPGDSAALSEAIAKLCADSALRTRFGAASAERARKFFSLEVMTQRFVDVYLRLARPGETG